MMYNRFAVLTPIVKVQSPIITSGVPDLYYKEVPEIVIDDSLDPDPYCVHGTPIHERLAAMGWPEDRLPYIREKNC